MEQPCNGRATLLRGIEPKIERNRDGVLRARMHMVPPVGGYEEPVALAERRERPAARQVGEGGSVGLLELDLCPRVERMLAREGPQARALGAEDEEILPAVELQEAVVERIPAVTGMMEQECNSHVTGV